MHPSFASVYANKLVPIFVFKFFIILTSLFSKEMYDIKLAIQFFLKGMIEVSTATVFWTKLP